MESLSKEILSKFPTSWQRYEYLILWRSKSPKWDHCKEEYGKVHYNQIVKSQIQGETFEKEQERRHGQGNSHKGMGWNI